MNTHKQKLVLYKKKYFKIFIILIINIIIYTYTQNTTLSPDCIDGFVGKCQKQNCKMIY